MDDLPMRRAKHNEELFGSIADGVVQKHEAA
jgi:hypothetical protein